MKERIWKILAADDEVELLDALELFLKKEHMVLYKARDGVEALNLFFRERPDLVLLDVMMPGMGGFSVLQKIRETSRVPAMMLTARTEDHDKILGLELGADDYITKPYNPLEVVARIKAQLRRSYDYAESGGAGEVVHSGDLELNLSAHTLFKGHELVELTGTEYKIIALLMSSPGQIFTKRQIAGAVWDDPLDTDGSTIAVHISNLRGKIEADAHRPSIIKTIKGLGYRFEKEK